MAQQWGYQMYSDVGSTTMIPGKLLLFCLIHEIHEAEIVDASQDEDNQISPMFGIPVLLNHWCIPMVPVTRPAGPRSRASSHVVIVRHEAAVPQSTQHAAA